MAPEERTEPPLGTVTFVLADVEPESAVERPERIIDAAVATHRGPGSTAWARAPARWPCSSPPPARSPPRTRSNAPWRGDARSEPVREARLRLGIHARGRPEALRAPGLWGGRRSRRASPTRDVAHGGQALLSSVTASLVADAPPPGAWLVDLGTHRLRDLSARSGSSSCASIDSSTSFRRCAPSMRWPTTCRCS